MFCRECGSRLEDEAETCPVCGARVRADAPDDGSWYWENHDVPDRRPRGRTGSARGRTIAIAVVAILLVSVLAVAFAEGPSSSDSNDYGSGTSETYTVSEDVSFSGTYLDYFEYSLSDEEDATVVTVTLKDEYASDYSYFTWYVRSAESGSLVGQIVKEEPVVYWTLSDDTLGEYTISVSCSNRNQSGIPGGGKSFYTQTYSVTATIDGTVTKSYSFTYGGETVSVSLEFSYSDYAAYSGTNGASAMKRAAYNNGTYSVVSDFIVVDETLSELEASLSAAYTETLSAAAEGQEYAEYLLAFVQCCFTYQDDAGLYSQSEYFAFPLETIYNGGGDCEDTSILLAALCTAAGYDAGVFIIPGHAIAAVSLDEYVAGSVSSLYASSVDTFSYETGGKTYYGCETTLTSNSYGIGWISDDYSIDSDGTITYNGTTYSKDRYGYGLYLAATES